MEHSQALLTHVSHIRKVSFMEVEVYLPNIAQLLSGEPTRVETRSWLQVLFHTTIPPTPYSPPLPWTTPVHPYNFHPLLICLPAIHPFLFIQYLSIGRPFGALERNSPQNACLGSSISITWEVWKMQIHGPPNPKNQNICGCSLTIWFSKLSKRFGC